MKVTRFSKAMKLTKYCMKPYKKQFYFAILLMTIACVVGGLTPFITGYAISELTRNVADMQAGVVGAGVNFPYILMIIGLFMGCSLVRQICTYLANFLLAGASQRSFKDLRTQISEKMNFIPVSYFDRHQQGTVLSAITNDVDALSNAIQQSLLVIVGAISSIAISFIMMFVISWKLTLIVLFLIPGAFVITRIVMRKSQQNFLHMQNSLADLNGYIQEHFNAFHVIKLYNYEQDSIEEFKAVNQTLNDHGFKANFVSSLLAPLLELLVNAMYALMVLLSGLAVFQGLDIGRMQSFVLYIWLIYDPLGQVTQLSSAMQSAFASMERIVNFLEEKEEEKEISMLKKDFSSFKGKIEFKHVAFSYTKKKPLIKDLSFVAEPGQTVAIVGATGAGKTTIINLLMRFYDIQKGDICIDGESIYAMNRSDERSLFGMVLQDAWLYHASIYENIRFGKLNASNYEIVEAAKMANVDHFIKTLPEGYDTLINEEAGNISLGQKQLLTIARAMIADPKIIILDEATSSVDTRLEILIQKAMKKVMEGRTSFVVAHRLSTIRDADLILVLDKGDIVEKGNHQELILKKGVYEKLYRNQFAED
ncbi:MAG: ABC transporter ATP-binding protein [Breznakia sp.]